MAFSASVSESKPSFEPIRWLITGGCGFIGRNLIKHLISEGGHQIRIVDNLSVGSLVDLSQVCNFSITDITAIDSQYPLQNELHSDVELITADILDSSLALQVSKDIDIIVHLAANTGVGPSVDNPKMDCETNVFGTFNYLEAARHNKVKRFIFASSGAPIGECTPPIHEELAPHPVSPYGASKLAGEAYCSAYYKTFGIETVALRFGNVYGPLSYNKSSIVAKFIKQALNGEICEVYGDGTQTRDFIYIDDLVKAIYRAATIYTPKYNLSVYNYSSSALIPEYASPCSRIINSSIESKKQNSFIGGETFQIATNKEHTINEVSEIIKNQLRDKYNIGIKLKYTERRLGDVKRNYSDTSKAKTVLNWQCTVPLIEGIERTVNWFIQQTVD